VRTIQVFLCFIYLTVVGDFLVPQVRAQARDFSPVTEQMLRNPSPDDWLSYSRTYDSQRYSPLTEINRLNVATLRMAWSRGMTPGPHQTIPLVYRGVMYVANPGGLQALDATNGDLIWEYLHEMKSAPASVAGGVARAGRTIAIYEDMIIYAAPDNTILAVDAHTGALHWEARTGYSSSGPKLVNGRVIAGIQARTGRAHIVALDARDGKELWRFYTAPAPGEPGGDTWGNLPVEARNVNPWGLPGSYDPVRNLVYWGIANPSPYTRIQRHGGNPDAISRHAPAELYGNSTVAIHADTGKLAWYYQHLPGDDWDQDFAHDRILLSTPFNPDPNAVKWINPGVKRGEVRDVSVTVGEPGGLFVNDRATGEFLWAMPFPFDVPEFVVGDVDVETGETYINWDQVFKQDGDSKMVCFQNSRGYWPLAYHPGENALFVPYHDECVIRSIDMKRERWDEGGVVRRPGTDPNAFGGIAKVNMATGETTHIYNAPIAGNGAMLTTAGNLLFWGDLNRRFRAFDVASGKILWETILGGIIQNSTITYAVGGKQYVAVLTGDGAGHTRTPLRLAPSIKPPRGHNAIYVFALP
jgi:alcohol dehydrogenase (cytochrome c)